MFIVKSSCFRSGSLFALLMCSMIGTVRADALMEFLQERTPSANNERVTYVSHQADPLLQMIQNLDGLTQDQEFPDLQYTRNNAFNPALSSTAAIVVDAQNGQVLYHKNSSTQMPIASITKLMTAMVVLDAQQDLQQMITVSTDDIDYLKNSSSRLVIGTSLSREEMLHLGLMSSENRAMHALGRAYPRGMPAFLQAMNNKAQTLGMNNTVFYDPTGLNPLNQSTAQDLVRLVQAAYEYPLIRQFSTSNDGAVLSARGKVLHYKNSNALVRGGEWKIDLQKTGYIRESGRSMVVRATIEERPLIIVLLDAPTVFRRVNDAQALRSMVTSGVM